MKTNNNHLIGAHLSIAGGFEQAIYEAHRLKCTAVQFFSKSNRQWHAPAITTEQLERYQQALNTHPLGYIAIHASYLINLANPDAAKRAQARAALHIEYERAAALNADALIVHPGSHGTGSLQASVMYVAQELQMLCAALPQGKTKILLETMAGQGSSICATFEQLATILDHVEHKDRLGVCLDTCHIYAAGYDLVDNYDEIWQQFDTTIGFKHLGAIHLNDSKKPLGSRVDRHEHIGQGFIGLAAFAKLLNDPRLLHVPKLLETPKDTPEDDERNLHIVWNLIKDVQ